MPENEDRPLDRIDVEWIHMHEDIQERWLDKARYLIEHSYVLTYDEVTLAKKLYQYQTKNGDTSGTREEV